MRHDAAEPLGKSPWHVCRAGAGMCTRRAAPLGGGGVADARAKSNTEERARGNSVGVMRAGSESVRVEAQPTHSRQQGRRAATRACSSNYETGSRLLRRKENDTWDERVGMPAPAPEGEVGGRAARPDSSACDIRPPAAGVEKVIGRCMRPRRRSLSGLRVSWVRPHCHTTGGGLVLRTARLTPVGPA